MTPVSHENPIKLYPDGNFWCALIGKNLQEGVAGFGKTPEGAVTVLMEQDEAVKLLPHAVTNVECPHCHHKWVAVHPFPFAGVFACPQCFEQFEQQVESL